MQVIPDYSYADAPPPDIVVVPAQHGRASVVRDEVGTDRQHHREDDEERLDALASSQSLRCGHGCPRSRSVMT